MQKQMVKIRKATVETVVHIDAFNDLYKPKGWELVEKVIDAGINAELASKGITDEGQQKQYITAKVNMARRKFSDNAFYSGR